MLTDAQFEDIGKGRFASLTLAILGTIMNITATLPEQIGVSGDFGQR